MSAARCSCKLETNMSLRCLIVDDNASFRTEVRGLLQEQGIDVVGTAGSGDEAVRLIEEARPDVVLIDIDLGRESGFEVVRRLAESASGAFLQMILISTHDEGEYADLIAASPAGGFLAKTDLSGTAIRTLLADLEDSRADGASRSDERRGT
jgi:DNA-binding NarL/FixJ family response regulator